MELEKKSNIKNNGFYGIKFYEKVKKYELILLDTLVIENNILKVDSKFLSEYSPYFKDYFSKYDRKNSLNLGGLSFEVFEKLLNFEDSYTYEEFVQLVKIVDRFKINFIEMYLYHGEKFESYEITSLLKEISNDNTCKETNVQIEKLLQKCLLIEDLGIENQSQKIKELSKNFINWIINLIVKFIYDENFREYILPYINNNFLIEKNIKDDIITDNNMIICKNKYYGYVRNTQYGIFITMDGKDYFLTNLPKTIIDKSAIYFDKFTYKRIFNTQVIDIHEYDLN